MKGTNEHLHHGVFIQSIEVSQKFKKILDMSGPGLLNHHFHERLVAIYIKPSHHHQSQENLRCLRSQQDNNVWQDKHKISLLIHPYQHTSDLTTHFSPNQSYQIMSFKYFYYVERAHIHTISLKNLYEKTRFYPFNGVAM